MAGYGRIANASNDFRCSSLLWLSDVPALDAAQLDAYLSDQDLDHLRDIMTRVRDHMRGQPPRSAAPRKRRG